MLALVLGPAGTATGRFADAEEGAADRPVSEPIDERGGDSTTPRGAPRVTMVRTEAPPVIDGRLDDPTWADASVIDDFRQVVPVEGAEPSERTEVRLLYDHENLYVGFRCFDREPDKINASIMAREGDLSSDDRVSFVIDTFFDRRNAFLFEMNPVGAEVDALVENNDRIRREWDGIWYGKATIDELGWTAEIAIPFKTVSFDPNGTRWGFNASRVIRRRTETVRWAAVSQNLSIAAIGDAGILEGLTEMTQGIGLDIRPYGLFRATHESGDGDSFEFDAGVDIRYRFTPSTALTLTINTDFAETEIDERQVNLTRFPLFFPEKRDFFLQDAGIFDFGGIRRNPLPFQSRRIGIGPGGEQQDILAGLKLTGREDPWNFGLLTVQMQDDDELGNKNLSVGRVALNVLDESTVGFIATAGDPTERGDNYVGGADFNYRDSTWNGDEVVDGNLWFQQSWTSNAEMDGSDSAYGFKLGYPNDRVNWRIGFSEIGEEFDAALGFVPRRGIREWFGNWRYRWRPQDEVIRRIDSGVRGTVITDLSDDVESRDVTIEVIEIETEANDSISFDYSFEREVLDEPFEIFDGVVIPVDDYRFDRWRTRLRTSTNRPVNFDVSVSGGEFYSGDRLQTTALAELRLSRHFLIGAEYEMNDVDLDEGRFITRVWRGRVNFFFTPDVSWTNFIQYDNVSDTLGINSRFRWIIEPGNELFLVLNQGWDVDDGSLESRVTEFTTKLNWTLRF